MRQEKYGGGDPEALQKKLTTPPSTPEKFMKIEETVLLIDRDLSIKLISNNKVMGNEKFMTDEISLGSRRVDRKVYIELELLQTNYKWGGD